MKIDELLKELTFKTMRSSGPGGQHVNKTSSKVEVSLDIPACKALSDSEKSLLEKRLKNRISSEGILSVDSSESRSQHRNKTIVIDKLISHLKENLTVQKKRKKTKPSQSAIKKRLKAKRHRALKKEHRKPPSP